MPARMPHRAVSIALAVGLIACLTACGASSPVQIGGTKLTLRLDEYRILPQKVEIHAGRIKIVAENTGILTHTLAVERVRRAASGDPVILARTSTVMPGSSQEVKAYLHPGRYLLVSTIANQADLGMTGTLIVR